MPEQKTDTKSLAHTKWNCKYHIVFAPETTFKRAVREKNGDTFAKIGWIWYNRTTSRLDGRGRQRKDPSEESPGSAGQGCRVIPGEGDFQESATENNRPFSGKDEKAR